LSFCSLKAKIESNTPSTAIVTHKKVPRQQKRQALFIIIAGKTQIPQVCEENRRQFF